MTVVVSIKVTEGDKTFERYITLGDRALKKVLSKFNPSEDGRVTALKALSGAQIQMMLEHQDEQARKPIETANPVPGEISMARSRAAAVAITQAEITQMCLVKSLLAEG